MTLVCVGRSKWHRPICPAMLPVASRSLSMCLSLPTHLQTQLCHSLISLLSLSMHSNLARLIGPYSDVVMIHQWEEGEAFTVSIVWIDPTNSVAASFDTKVSAMESELFTV